MKNFTRILFLALCFAITASTLYSGTVPRGVKISGNSTGYRVDFNLPECGRDYIKGGNQEYLLLNIPEYGITSETGLPQLPQISFFLLIGRNEQSVQISSIKQDKITNTLNTRIYPKQMPWEKSKKLDDRPFVINEQYYNSKGSSDGPFAVVSEPFVMGGAKGVMVTIYPFAYNPSRNELTETRSGSFNINLNQNAVLDFFPRPAMDEFFASTFVNYEFKNSKGTNNYLIITAADYESGLTPFVTHKQGLGYNVTVVNTGVTGTTNTAIKAYIQNLYNNVSTRPEFILLVGDIDKIPEWIGVGEGTPHTDWNYGLLEGNDQYVDAFVGRFPIQNLTQLSNIITKSIYMENGVNSLWKKNVFMASTDNHNITEATHNFVIDSFFIPNQFTVNTKLYSYYGATTSQVTQSIDSGKIFAIYSGHGSETSWADGPVFSQSNVNALNNTIFPFVYSFACITGSYHISGECFAETWIRIAKGGSVFWGSSVNSYWDEDDILERRIGRAMFTENLKRNAENFVRGKVLLIQYYGSITSTMQRYIEMYNCMGDPSIYQRAYGPAISHTPLPNTENLSGPYAVNCVVTPSGSAITGTKLFWTRTTAFDSLTMTNTSGNNWSSSIPGNGSTATYKYYIRTQDAMGRVTYLPGGAPANYFTFTASTDNIKPVITHTTLQDVPKVQWPATLSANVTDNIGVDSVWVRWYKNNTSTGIKHFKLNLTAGNNYAAAFNSLNGDVNYNDSIFYKIFARDISSMHNTDSTTLKKFKIINLVNACVGTGSTSSNYPFTTYWMDGRTQMLFTAAELNAAGAGANSSITKIGFNVITASNQIMSGFNVRFQHTTQATLTGWVTSGWTTAFTGSYTVPGTGWQYIDMTSPYFMYNGTSNLLVEICYDNSAYTSYSTVNSTSAPSMTWGYYTDNTTGCTMTSGSSQSNRPNTCFTMTTLVSTGNQTTVIPDKFELSQNYPNPFNPMTKINFALPKQGLVTLKIYDVLGREIKTLVNEVKQAGSYSVDFNGAEFSSGVYFYKLTSGDFVDIKRMILVK
ncbi:MAG TPA: C25 family cysteine peptidase [Ignavibacteria bacterium]|nr:C25 family cysteine peptidase [Ignavibacteria bacterium]